MIATSIYTENIPKIFEAFKSEIGDQYWVKRVQKIRSAIKGQPFLKQYLLAENSIAFMLDRCGQLARNNWSISESTDLNEIFPAISFAAQTLSVIKTNNAQKHQIIRRVQSGFKNPDDQRAMLLELSAATHFVQRGYSISWPEMNGSGTYDLFAVKPGNQGLEVECKLISNDKGRKIHRRDALELHHIAKGELASFAKRLNSGLSIVLSVPDRLPKDAKSRLDLVVRAKKQLILGQSANFEDGVEIRISDFDSTVVYPHDVSLKEVVDKVTATDNREAMIIGGQGAGCLAFVIQSKAEDSLLKYLFDTLSDAAKTQFTKQYAGLLFVGFHGVTSEELRSVAEQDFSHGQPPTALRVAVSDFLDNKNRDHVIGTCFASRGALTTRTEGKTETGSVYFFNNEQSPMWHSDFSRLFTE